EAELEPCPYAKMAAPQALPEGGRCEPVYVDFGSLRLRVGIEGAGKDESDAHRRARKLLQEIAGAHESLVELAAAGQRADIIARLKGDKIYLATPEVAQLVGE